MSQSLLIGPNAGAGGVHCRVSDACGIAVAIVLTVGGDGTYPGAIYLVVVFHTAKHIREIDTFIRGTSMQFIITVDCDEDGAWITECPAIPGCVSRGQTKKEAIANIQEAIQLCLEVRAEQGLPLSLETRQLEIAALMPSLPGSVPQGKYMQKYSNRTVLRPDPILF